MSVQFFTGRAKLGKIRHRTSHIFGKRGLFVPPAICDVCRSYTFVPLFCVSWVESAITRYHKYARVGGGWLSYGTTMVLHKEGVNGMVHR